MLQTAALAFRQYRREALNCPWLGSVDFKVVKVVIVFKEWGDGAKNVNMRLYPIHPQSQ